MHYHTPDLVRPAVAALLADATASDVSVECILVDNGSRPGEDVAWQGLPLTVIRSGANLGYAGGANLGAEHAEGDALVIMNPDVEVLPGCLTQLGGALDAGAAACGPRFFWDREQRFLLPPTERRRPRDELAAIVARRGGRCAVRPRHAWRQHARRYWTATAPVVGHALSGALLAIHRDAWQEIGPFDAGYQLYFEETDWLERLRNAGGQAWHLPGAGAVHHYACSTRNEPRSEGWFVTSSRRFQERFYGRLVADSLATIDHLLPESAEGPEQSVHKSPSPLPPERASKPPTWLEVSVGAAGYPATACRLEGSTAESEQLILPAELRAQLPPTGATLRTVDDAGREQNAWSVGGDEGRLDH